MSYIPLVSISGATVRTLRATKLDTSDRESTGAAPSKSHLILVIDQSGSMYYSMEEMRATLTKLLALEEYKNSDLLVSLVSYSGKGELLLHDRVGGATMPITASQIRALREKTGHALVLCRDALRACKGHADLAEQWLEVKGQAVATLPGRAPYQLVEAEAARRSATGAG